MGNGGGGGGGVGSPYPRIPVLVEGWKQEQSISMTMPIFLFHITIMFITYLKTVTIEGKIAPYMYEHYILLFGGLFPPCFTHIFSVNVPLM